MSGPIVPDYAKQTSPAPSLIWPVLALCAAALIVAALWWRTRADQVDRLAPIAITVPVEADSQSVEPQPVIDVGAIYQKDIVPLLDESLQRKQDAAGRALAILHARLNGHRKGIPAFAEDVTSWGTRFGVLGRSTRDAFRKARRKPDAETTRRYVEAKFRTHVMSEIELEAAVGAAVEQFRADLEADRNLLMSQIRVPLKASGAPVLVADAEWEAIRRDIMRAGSDLAMSGSTDSVVNAAAAFAAGEAAGISGRHLVAQILARVGPIIGARLAGSGVAAGAGAMAGAAGGGGTAGSIGGPAGTIIGAGVGLAVGAVIDWWMTARFQEQLRKRCNAFVDSVQLALITGTKQSPGVEPLLAEAVRVTDAAQRQAIHDVLVQRVGSP
ncbi:MAG TPA: hypothetical protein VGR35_20830 [Tepidisphaeraceae bacterium]|nr:hypothetical protein [Tepidisphaeraceae bacterium]